MLTTNKGSCHCGKIRFEATLDLSAGTGKCNCSICAKRRYWGVVLKPDAFRLLSGEADLAEYQFAARARTTSSAAPAAWHPAATGRIEAIGGDYRSVNVACVDDVDPQELAEAPVQYMDGRNDNWWNPPAETRHL
jgi:hypothetical protein